MNEKYSYSGKTPQKHTTFKGSNFPKGIEFVILSHQTSDGRYLTVQIQDEKELQQKRH
jgi:hypothetical protein